MSTQQNKTAAFIALALIVVIGFLHYPFDGYTSTYTVREWTGEGECKQRTAEQIRAMTWPEIQEAQKCRQEHDHEETLSVTDWSSDKPLLPWFGPLMHTLSAIALVLVLWGGWAALNAKRT